MNAKHAAMVLAAAWIQGAAAWADQPASLPDPGQPGSHERYAEFLRSESDRVANELLARYERRGAEAPEDRVAAMERCLFLGGEAFYDPETEESTREDERIACIEDVEARFPSDPDARVFAIEQRWDADSAESARRFLDDPPAGATSRHVAAVHAHLARQLYRSPDQDRIAHAEQAMQLDPSLDLRVLIARAKLRLGDRAGAREVLMAGLAETRDSGDLFQKATLLSELEAFEPALSAFEDVQRRDPDYEPQFAHARALAGVGRIDEAREIYARDGQSWHSDDDLEERFQFELRHGNAESAHAAYDSIRERGWKTDPVGRQRLALLVAHPGAVWTWRDASGLAMLAAIAFALLMLPAVWILPIYGIGLLRSHPAPGDAPQRFGLREAWIVSATSMAAQSAALFVYPGALEAGRHGVDAVSDVGRATLVTAVLSASAALFVARREVLAMFARGCWGWMRTVVSAVSLVAVFRFALALVAQSGASPVDNETTDAVFAVERSFGLPTGLLSIAVLIPLAEEISFRGILLSAFRTRLPAFWANVAQAALFGLAHAHPILSPAFFFYGLAAGYLTRASGSLRSSSIAHIVNNALACVIIAVFR